MHPTRRGSPRPFLFDSEIVPRELRVAPGVYAYYGWKNVSVGIWVGQAVKSAVSGLVEMSHEMAKAYPGGRSSVVFVLDQLPGPTPDAQEEMQRVYASGGLECTAIVLEGTGFWASGIRSMTNNVRRAAASATLLRLSTSIEEVIDWLPAAHFEHTGVTLPAPEFQNALVAMREQGAIRAAVAPKPPG
jgi:hypothetical protein